MPSSLADQMHPVGGLKSFAGQTHDHSRAVAGAIKGEDFQSKKNVVVSLCTRLRKTLLDQSLQQRKAL